MGLLNAIASFLGLGDAPPATTPYRTSTIRGSGHTTGGEAISRSDLGKFNGSFASLDETKYYRKASSVDGLERVVWLGPGSTLKHQGYEAIAPLVYLSLDGGGHPAFVNLHAKVGAPFATDPGYWPNWDGLNSENRGAWLAWLRDGRRQPGFNIGLVFLYFYGLERRALIDRKDISAIHAELCGLLSVYGNNRSLLRYTCGLLAALHILDRTLPVTVTLQAITTVPGVPIAVVGGSLAVSLPAVSAPPELLEIILTLHQGPLDAGLAAAVCQALPGATRSPAIKQVWGDFSALFATRFRERWPNGHPLVPPSDRPKKTMEYQWAGQFAERPVRRMAYPSQLDHVEHWIGLLETWNDCIRDLRKLAALAKEGTPDQRARFAALPPELREASDHPDFKLWEDWFRKARKEDGFASAAISELVIRLAQPCPVDGKLRPTQAKQLAERLEQLGFALEPDPRVTGKSVQITEQRIVYRPAGGVVVTPGPAYIGLQTIVELCISVASADGNIAEDEITQIFGLLDRDDELPGPERERLRAHVTYQQLVKGDIATISAARLSKVSPESRSIIASMVVAIALADGAVTKEELEALKKIYRALGLPKEQLDNLLGTGPKTPAASGTQDGIVSSSGVTINWAAVEALQRETNDVQHLLGKALAECAIEDVSDVDSGLADDAPSSDLPKPLAGVLGESPFTGVQASRFAGLELKYQPILAECLRRASFSASDFRTLCASHGAMPAAAIEILNEWSDEHAGGFLIDASSLVTIDPATSDLLRSRFHE